jgi:ParB-like chromosome segregation protein Spo0J
VREDFDVNKLPTFAVPLRDLVMAESPRQGGESREHVELLAAVTKELPPIIVHRPTMRLIDGYHRVEAARLRGADVIAVRFFEGDETEAFVLAVRLNVSHGLPLTLVDRKRAAERIMRSRPKWSDRRVALVSGISPGTVASIRKRSVSGIEYTESRIGQDGRVRPVDASAGRKLAGELLTQNPTLSLRQVARLAAISPETVRDVRIRLERGASLEMSPRAKRPVVDGVVPDHRGTGQGKERMILELAPKRGHGPVHGPIPDREMVVRWLTADPALRFSETGRNLLRLLALHHALTRDWDGIVAHVPSHCNEIVADLAREFALLWTDLAVRAGTERSLSRRSGPRVRIAG